MRALHLDKLNVDQLRGLDDLYRTTRDVRVRTRAQMILLLAEQGLTLSEVAAIVRESGETVRRWVHRYEAEGTTASPTRRARASRPKPEPLIASGWSSWCGGGHVPWTCRSRCGPPHGWPTAWQRRRACA